MHLPDTSKMKHLANISMQVIFFGPQQLVHIFIFLSLNISLNITAISMVTELPSSPFVNPYRLTFTSSLSLEKFRHRYKRDTGDFRGMFPKYDVWEIVLPEKGDDVGDRSAVTPAPPCSIRPRSRIEFWAWESFWSFCFGGSCRKFKWVWDFLCLIRLFVIWLNCNFAA